MEKYKAAVDALFDLIIEVDFNKREVELDQAAFFRLFGSKPKEDFIDFKRLFDLSSIHPDDRTNALRLSQADCLNRQINFGLGDVDFRVCNMSQEYTWIRCVIIPSAEERSIYLICFRDITDEKSKSAALLEASKRDPHTSLYNKQHTVERIKDAMTKSVEGALMLIDIDDFKLINDKYGHLLGDAVILATANALRQMFLNGRVLGRVGGDEFLAYFPNVTKTKALELAASIVKVISGKRYGEDKSCGVTASVGVARYPKDGKTYESLFNSADKAAYFCKNNGKNNCAIYNSKTMGAMFASKLNDIIEQDYYEQTSFVEYIYRILNDTHDSDVAIDLSFQMTIRRFGASYGLVYITGQTSDKVKYLTRCADCAEFNTKDFQHYLDQLGIREGFDDNGKMSLDKDGIKAKGEGLQKYNIGSCIAQAIIVDNKVYGAVVFLSCCGWNESEAKSLSFIAKTMAVFISKKMSIEALKRENIKLKEMVEQLSGGTNND